MRRSRLPTVLALFLSFTVVGTAMAIHAPLLTNVTTASARGTLDEKVNYERDGIEIETKGPVDIVTAEVLFAKGTPTGATSGWHNHPGPVFVVLISGTLDVWDKQCAHHTYTVGDSFFEAGPSDRMLVKNVSTTVDALVYATFIVPVGATPLLTRKPHRCGLAE